MSLSRQQYEVAFPASRMKDCWAGLLEVVYGDDMDGKNATRASEDKGFRTAGLVRLLGKGASGRRVLMSLYVCVLEEATQVHHEKPEEGPRCTTRRTSLCISTEPPGAALHCHHARPFCCPPPPPYIHTATRCSAPALFIASSVQPTFPPSPLHKVYGAVVD